MGARSANGSLPRDRRVHLVLWVLLAERRQPIQLTFDVLFSVLLHQQRRRPLAARRTVIEEERRTCQINAYAA